MVAAEQKGPNQLVTRGSICKVGLTIDNVRTRGLLDLGTQVSLVRKELLTTIKAHHGRSKEVCGTRNLKMKLQPVGAEVGPLGAIALVKLQIRQVRSSVCLFMCLSPRSQSGKVNCITVFDLRLL